MYTSVCRATVLGAWMTAMGCRSDSVPLPASKELDGAGANQASALPDETMLCKLVGVRPRWRRSKRSSAARTVARHLTARASSTTMPRD